MANDISTCLDGVKRATISISFRVDRWRLIRILSHDLSKNGDRPWTRTLVLKAARKYCYEYGQTGTAAIILSNDAFRNLSRAREIVDRLFPEYDE